MTAGSPSCGKCGRTRGACKAAWQHSAARAELPHRHRPRHHRCRHDVGAIMASAARRRPGSSRRHRSFAPSFLPSRPGGTAGQCRILARPPLPSLEPQNCRPPDNLESTCGNDVVIGPTCHPQWQHPWILGSSPRKTDVHDETSAASRLLEPPPTAGSLLHRTTAISSTCTMCTTRSRSTVDAMPTTPRLDAPPTDIAPGVRCAPSTCAEQTHDELSTPLPSPLTSGNR